MKKVIELQNVRRDFVVGDEVVHALRGVSFTITRGNSSLSWALPDLGNPLFSTSLAASIRPPQANTYSTEYPYGA